MASLSSATESKRKRKKDSGRESKRKKKEKKHGGDAEDTKTRGTAKYKSLMQLAKLVQGGNLTIPQSLDSYIDDNVILLDQLFTILTQKDIEGMLPDVLKNYKLRHVKELCMNELQKMSMEELWAVLSGQSENKTENDQTSSEREWRTRQETTPPVDEQGTPIMEISDISDEEEKSHDQSPDQADNNQVSDSRDGSCDQSHDSVKTHSRSHDNSTSEKNGGALIRVSIDSDDDIELMIGSDELSDSSEEWVHDITENQKLLELHMRNRLLERSLNCNNDNATGRDSTGGRDCRDAGITADTTDGITDGKELMEMKLRQRALQSLIANKQRSLSL